MKYLLVTMSHKYTTIPILFFYYHKLFCICYKYNIIHYTMLRRNAQYTNRETIKLFFRVNVKFGTNPFIIVIVSNQTATTYLGLLHPEFHRDHDTYLNIFNQ